ncbi:MAG: helix-turn-helix domain-containing protein [Lachnospiraceae bacterium]
MMNTESIMECIGVISDEAPKLRDILNITQLEFAKIIGISRQSVIDFEHRNRKITRPVLISMICYFSLRKETALYLYERSFYNNEYVSFLGFSAEMIEKTYGIGSE